MLDKLNQPSALLGGWFALETVTRPGLGVVELLGLNSLKSFTFNLLRLSLL